MNKVEAISINKKTKDTKQAPTHRAQFIFINECINQFINEELKPKIYHSIVLICYNSIFLKATNKCLWLKKNYHRHTHTKDPKQKERNVSERTIQSYFLQIVGFRIRKGK